MTDFFQNGVIATLQRLGNRPLTDLEDDLREFGERQRIVLILPSLYSEFEGPAMPGIVEQLKGARYLHKIILSLDRADEQQFERVKGIMSSLPTEVSVIWHDGPRMQSCLAELEAANFPMAEQGKGRGVWFALGCALADKRVRTIALHDCDIINYDRSMLARLVYPIAHPGTDFEFSKGYYARVNKTLHGRVTRLFFTPLIRTLKKLIGDLRFFEFLDSFRYPLSGEFAMIRSLATGIRVSPSWGLEVSLLGEVFEKTTVQRVCQVEIADSYEHKHQPLSRSDPDSGLAGMAADIAITLFQTMAQGGIILSESLFNTMLASYLRQARLAIEYYNALALLNGLLYDRHEEVEAVEVFVEALRTAARRFRDDPIGTPPLAGWVRVRAAMPGFTGRLAEAVELDNASSVVATASGA